MAISRLLVYAHGQRNQVLRASCYSVLNKIVDLAPPVLIGVAVDIVVKREQSALASFGLVDGFSQLVALAILTVIV